MFRWFQDKVMGVVYGAVDARLLQAGQMWEQKSRALAPNRTGFLASMETFQVDKATHTLRLQMGAYYDIYQEFGTRFIPPRPHVRPALNEIGRLFGGNIAMEFAVNPNHAGLLASTGKGRAPGFAASARAGWKSLTPKQARHVQDVLIPSARAHHRGNVRRATFTTR